MYLWLPSCLPCLLLVEYNQIWQQSAEPPTVHCGSLYRCVKIVHHKGRMHLHKCYKPARQAYIAKHGTSLFSDCFALLLVKLSDNTTVLICNYLKAVTICTIWNSPIPLVTQSTHLCRMYAFIFLLCFDLDYMSCTDGVSQVRENTAPLLWTIKLAYNAIKHDTTPPDVLKENLFLRLDGSRVNIRDIMQKSRHDSRRHTTDSAQYNGIHTSVGMAHGKSQIRCML